jgi:putative Mg2+ transporter-C (MgtC) family protein
VSVFDAQWGVVRHVPTMVGVGAGRVSEAIIRGVSLFGAAPISRRNGEEDVEGLTTAASILVTAGLGVSVTLGQWIVATVPTGLVLLAPRAVQLVAARRARQAARAGGRIR